MAFKLAEAYIDISAQGIPQVTALISALNREFMLMSAAAGQATQQTTRTTQAIGYVAAQARTAVADVDALGKALQNVRPPAALMGGRGGGGGGGPNVFGAGLGGGMIATAAGFGTFALVSKLAGAIKDAGVAAISSAADFETAQVAMTQFAGSASVANHVLEEMTKFSVAAPTLQFPEVLEAGRQLMAFGVTAQQVAPTIRVLADISAGTQVPLERLVLLYGKVATEGRVMSRDLMQWGRALTPMIETLAKNFGVTEFEIRKMVTEGKVGFTDLQRALETMTNEGGRFHGMQQAQANTTKGAWNILMDVIGVGLRKIGQELDDAFNFEGLLGKAVNFFSNLVDLILATIGYLKKLKNAVVDLIPESGQGAAGKAFAAALGGPLVAASIVSDTATGQDAMADIKEAAKGAGGGLTGLVTALDEAKEAAEEAARAEAEHNKELDRSAKSVRRDLDPWFNLSDTIEKLDELKKSGRISNEDYQEAKTHAQRRYDKEKQRRDDDREDEASGYNAAKHAKDRKKREEDLAEMLNPGTGKLRDLQREQEIFDIEKTKRDKADREGAKARVKAIHAGVSDAVTLDAIASAAANIERLKSRDKAREDAEHMHEQLRTPEEKMKAAFDDLHRLNAAGLSEEDQRRAAEKAINEFASEYEKEHPAHKSSRFALGDLQKNLNQALLDSEAKQLAREQAKNIAQLATNAAAGGPGLLVQWDANKMKFVLGR